MSAFAARLSCWFGAQNRAIRSAGPLGLGALASLGQAPVGWPLASILAFLAVFLLLSDLRSIRAGLWVGWMFGSGYFLVTLFWITDPFMVDAAATGWMAPFALVFMAGGLALFWMAAFGLAVWLGSGPKTRVLAVVVTLSLAELARANVLTGFPWALPGYIWADTPLAQFAAFAGPHGLVLLTLALAGLPLITRYPALGLGLSAALFLGLWSAGSLRLSAPLGERKTPIRLRLVQPNAAQAEKWDPKMMPVFFRRQLALTRAVAKTPPDLVIWPETSIPGWLDEQLSAQKEIVDAAPSGSRVIVGARLAVARRYYNVLALLGARGYAQQVYAKAHLVPFGEYVPFAGLLSRFGIYGLAAEDGGGFSAGHSAALLDFGALGRVRALICYEAIFPQEIWRSGPRPDWMLQITNDAWFGKRAGPQQHFQQARFRAIEQGLPLVRVANTGVTAVIDARGQISARLPFGVAGKLDAVLPPSLPPTVYSRTGDGPVILLLLLLGGGLLVRRLANRD